MRQALRNIFKKGIDNIVLLIIFEPLCEQCEHRVSSTHGQVGEGHEGGLQEGHQVTQVAGGHAARLRHRPVVRGWGQEEEQI